MTCTSCTRHNSCYYMSMSKTVFFQGGTLVVQHDGEQEPLSLPFQLIKGRWRCEGYHYIEQVRYLREQGIRDNVRLWQPLDLILQEKREPHDYQLEALAAWDEAGR